MFYIESVLTPLAIYKFFIIASAGPLKSQHYD